MENHSQLFGYLETEDILKQVQLSDKYCRQINKKCQPMDVVDKAEEILLEHL